LKWLIAIFFRRKPLDAMIARRAMRMHNRNPEAAAVYERVHRILARK
jgi:hypothetical protein